MLTVLIKDDGEENVTRLTYDNLYRELKDISGADLKITNNWFDGLSSIKNKYVCFVEADCLVNSGYFSSQIGLFKKNPYFRKLAMLSSSVGVNDWANRFYGYSLGNNYSDGVIPVRQKKSSVVYPIQIGYVPGAILRVNMLIKVLNDLDMKTGATKDLIRFSTDVSLAFWRQGDGNRVHINPNTTYVTTEDYVNDIGRFDSKGGDLLNKFAKESIS